jgi:hypothetical protein
VWYCRAVPVEAKPRAIGAFLYQVFMSSLQSLYVVSDKNDEWVLSY